tara:strand:+ start:193 stop:462 length:270 start_codon:yes stop_codon:yes gene_type:complete
LLFFDINNPTPNEIKHWMKSNNLSINEAAKNLGISKRQFSRFLSGETNAKRIHSLAMQMVWLINENKKRVINESNQIKKDSKKISIPIK